MIEQNPREITTCDICGTARILPAPCPCGPRKRRPPCCPKGATEPAPIHAVLGCSP